MSSDRSIHRSAQHAPTVGMVQSAGQHTELVAPAGHRSPISHSALPQLGNGATSAMPVSTASADSDTGGTGTRGARLSQLLPLVLVTTNDDCSSVSARGRVSACTTWAVGRPEARAMYFVTAAMTSAMPGETMVSCATNQRQPRY